MYFRLVCLLAMAFLHSDVLGSAPAPGMMLMMMLPYQQQMRAVHENEIVMDEDMMTQMESNMESIEKEMAQKTYEKHMEMKSESAMKSATDSVAASSAMKSKDNAAMMEQLMEKISAMIKKMSKMHSAGEASPDEMLGAVMEEVETNAEMEMIGGCEKLGMFLPIPNDKCHFAQCTYGEEPWKTGGKARIVPTKMKCPPGLAVSGSYKGGYDLPCTEVSTGCTLKEAASVPKSASSRTHQRTTKYD